MRRDYACNFKWLLNGSLLQTCVHIFPAALPFSPMPRFLQHRQRRGGVVVLRFRRRDLHLTSHLAHPLFPPIRPSLLCRSPGKCSGAATHSLDPITTRHINIYGNLKGNISGTLSAIFLSPLPSICIINATRLKSTYTAAIGHKHLYFFFYSRLVVTGDLDLFIYWLECTIIKLTGCVKVILHVDGNWNAFTIKRWPNSFSTLVATVNKTHDITLIS